MLYEWRMINNILNSPVTLSISTRASWWTVLHTSHFPLASCWFPLTSRRLYSPWIMGHFCPCCCTVSDCANKTGCETNMFPMWGRNGRRQRVLMCYYVCLCPQLFFMLCLCVNMWSNSSWQPNTDRWYDGRRHKKTGWREEEKPVITLWWCATAADGSAVWSAPCVLH